MKKIFFYTLLVIIAGVGCRKKDNPKLPDFTRVPMPTITKDAGSMATISGTDPNSFTGKFTIDLYFKNDVKPAKFDIVIIKNSNKAVVKTVQPDVTSFPASVTITGAQLATWFGSAVVVGDRFDIGADVTTQAGQKFEAFPASGVGYGSGVATQGGASTSIFYSAVCPFDINDFAGNFKLTVDDWNDFGVGTILPITKVSATQLSFVSPVNGAAIKIDINAGLLVPSVASQAYGDYKAAGIDPTWTFGMANIVSASGNKNFIDACSKTISMALSYTTATAPIYKRWRGISVSDEKAINIFLNNNNKGLSLQSQAFIIIIDKHFLFNRYKIVILFPLLN